MPTHEQYKAAVLDMTNLLFGAVGRLRDLGDTETWPDLIERAESVLLTVGLTRPETIHNALLSRFEQAGLAGDPKGSGASR